MTPTTVPNGPSRPATSAVTTSAGVRHSEPGSEDARLAGKRQRLRLVRPLSCDLIVVLMPNHEGRDVVAVRDGFKGVIVKFAQHT
jgi:hypothetical protein